MSVFLLCDKKKVPPRTTHGNKMGGNHDQLDPAGIVVMIYGSGFLLTLLALFICIDNRRGDAKRTPNIPKWILHDRTDGLWLRSDQEKQCKGIIMGGVCWPVLWYQLMSQACVSCWCNKDRAEISDLYEEIV